LPNENQRWSPTTSAYFLKRDYSDGQSLGVKAYENWWQGDTVVHTVNLDVPVNPSEWVIQLDMKPMQEGTHVLHFRSCDTKGLWSVTTTHELERVPIPLFSADRTTLCDKGVIRFHNDMDSARFDSIGITAMVAHRLPLSRPMLSVLLVPMCGC
jgi:hypothetical protein